MGPVRGTLFLFPYGILAFWLGWCWFKEKSWKLSLTIGVIIGTFGFFLRVIALSTLVGDNLWVLITRASYGLIEKFIGLFNFPLSPSILSIQIGAILLIIFQEIVYVLTVHVVAYSLFPRFKLTIPDPPRLLNLPFSPSILSIQIGAILLIIFQYFYLIKLIFFGFITKKMYPKFCTVHSYFFQLLKSTKLFNILGGFGIFNLNLGNRE